MSEKQRQKKDGKRTDQKHKATREGENQKQQQSSPRHRARDESNLTDKQPGPHAAANRNREQ